MCVEGQRLIFITVSPSGDIMYMTRFSMTIIYLSISKLSIEISDSVDSSTQCISPIHPPNFAWVYDVDFVSLPNVIVIGGDDLYSL